MLAESYIFLQRHAYAQDYNNCEANTRALEKFVVDENLPWTADSLEIAFEKLTAQQKLAPPTVRHVETTLEHPVEVEAPLDIRWTPNPLTREAVDNMTAAECRKWRKHSDPRVVAEFDRQLSAVVQRTGGNYNDRRTRNAGGPRISAIFVS